MPKYSYTALDNENNKIIDTVDARDDDDFRRIMRLREIYPIKFKSFEDKNQSYKLKSNEVSEFCRQLSSMLSSGITAVRAMEIIKNRDYKPKHKLIYEKMYKDIQKGMAISEAMRVHDKAFPEFLINMFASGESSSRLENVTERMAIHYDKEHKINSKIKSATRYPKILGFTTISVVIVIFVFILPNFFNSLQDIELPGITRFIIAISNMLIDYWYVFVIISLILLVLIRSLFSIYKIALAFDKFKLYVPVIGKLLRIIYTARFSRTLSSLYSSGVPMIKALEITGTIVMNLYIEAQFPQLIKNVRNGELLSEAVRKIEGFDSKLASTILIGEESGRLDTMLVSTADSFEYEAEQATGAMVQLSEPIMLIVLGGLILIVILSVMMPMVGVYESF